MEVLDVLLVLCVFVVPMRSEGEEACETLPSEIHITKGLLESLDTQLICHYKLKFVIVLFL